MLSSNVSREVWSTEKGVSCFASAGARAWGGHNGFTVKIDAVSSKDEDPDLEVKSKAKAQLCHSLAM